MRVLFAHFQNESTSNVYADMYKRLLKVAVYSVMKHCPDVDLQVERIGNATNIDVVKEKWIQYGLSTTDNTVFLDGDILVLRDFSEVFDQDFDVGVTVTGNRRSPVNAGVVFMKPTERAKYLMNEWQQIINWMRLDKAEGIRYCKSWDCVDQPALQHLQMTNKDIIELPCAIYNRTQRFYEEPLADCAILHVKSQLRGALFGFSQAKYRDIVYQDSEVAKAWRQYEAEANDENNWNLFIEERRRLDRAIHS